MATIIDEYDSRTSFVSSLRHSDAEVRLSGLYKWLIEQPATKSILDSLAAKVDVAKLLEGVGNYVAPKASTPEEIASVGIRILEDCGSEKMFRLSWKYGVLPTFSGYNFQDQLNEFLERFILPTLEYIRNQLVSQDELATPVDYLRFQLKQLLEDPFRANYPETIALLDQISVQLTSLEASDSWFNIANSCREALKTFTTELSTRHEFALTPETKAGDVKAILKAFILDKYSQGRYADTLSTLVESLWDHLQPMLHRKSTTKQDAGRAYIWTCMVILELNSLTDSVS